MKWNTIQTTTKIGNQAENAACEHLLLHNLTLLTQNFHSRYGEIDLIMEDKSTIVFVEVKYRKSDSFGGAVASVSKSKQNKIKLCAKFYLQQQHLNEYNTACRFDIITLDGNIQTPNISWIKNAF